MAALSREIGYRVQGGALSWMATATDAPYDFEAAAEALLPCLTVLAALATLALGLSAAFLRRTRPDLRPIVVAPDTNRVWLVGLRDGQCHVIAVDPASGEVETDIAVVFAR